jgi:hypothetical protein
LCTLSYASSSLNIKDSIFFLINSVFIFNYLDLRSLVVLNLSNELLLRALSNWESGGDDIGVLILGAILSRDPCFLILDLLIRQVMRDRFLLLLGRWFLYVLLGGYCLHLVYKLAHLLCGE